MTITVAIVGAGPLGLMSLKNLREDGFDATVFEKRPYVGGLWKPSQDSSVSIVENTVFNSSRFVSTIPDFPWGDHVDDFPSATQLYEYMNSYADHFHLRPHIHLSTEVVSVRRIDQKWEVKTTTEGSEPKVQYFDKLQTCTGAFVTPRYPKIDQIEQFQGSVTHSIQFPGPSSFKGQNVVLVGLHATSQDITVALSKYASKVYIAHRTGVVLLPRYEDDGRTYDQVLTMNFFLSAFLFMSKYFPTIWYRFVDSMFTTKSKKAFPNQPKEWQLSPAPSIAVSTPVIATELFPLMENGFATPVPGIDHITGPKQVKLTDGRVLDDVDALIYCTGYLFDVPKFLPPEYHPYPVPDEAPYLYLNMFPLHPDPAVRNSLAFLGQAGFPFPGFAQFEAYGLAVSQIWQGKKKLPPLAEMRHWHAKTAAWRSACERQYGHRAYTAFLETPEIFTWLNDTAGLGLFEYTSWFSWRAWKLWSQDRKLYKIMTTGLFTPTIWRLFDVGGRKPWSGAREQIFKDNEFAKLRAAQRVEKMKAEKAGKKSV